MTILLVGASGATGRLLVEQLLEARQSVKVVVRADSVIPKNWESNENVKVIKKNITEIGVEEMSEYLFDCQSVASCLGHNPTWKGMFGEPGKLVAGTVKLLCEAVIKNDVVRPIKFVLMNTAGNSNRDLKEPASTAQKIVIGLLRLLLPPHTDNESAADYLRVTVGQNNEFIEWVAVRPDSLTDEATVSSYSLHKSPTRSAIFNPGKTSRINIAHFMAKLLVNEELWDNWKGQMPVIYNKPVQIDP